MNAWKKFTELRLKTNNNIPIPVIVEKVNHKVKNLKFNVERFDNKIINDDGGI